MIKIISEDSKEVKRTKKGLEKELNVTIEILEKEIIIDGSAENEYIAEKVIEAINFGFPVSAALMIKKEDLIFEILDIKDYTKKKDVYRIRARIIGSGGKTLQTLSNLTRCNFQIKENRVGIIGSPELIKNAQDSVILIIQGSKQANVYSYLEKHRIKPVIDLGLKKGKKSKKTKE